VPDLKKLIDSREALFKTSPTLRIDQPWNGAGARDENPADRWQRSTFLSI